MSTRGGASVKTRPAAGGPWNRAAAWPSSQRGSPNPHDASHMRELRRDSPDPATARGTTKAILRRPAALAGHQLWLSRHLRQSRSIEPLNSRSGRPTSGPAHSPEPPRACPHATATLQNHGRATTPRACNSKQTHHKEFAHVIVTRRAIAGRFQKSRRHWWRCILAGSVRWTEWCVNHPVRLNSGGFCLNCFSPIVLDDCFRVVFALTCDIFSSTNSSSRCCSSDVCLKNCTNSCRGG